MPLPPSKGEDVGSKVLASGCFREAGDEEGHGGFEDVLVRALTSNPTLPTHEWEALEDVVDDDLHAEHEGGWEVLLLVSGIKGGVHPTDKGSEGIVNLVPHPVELHGVFQIRRITQLAYPTSNFYHVLVIQSCLPTPQCEF